MSVAIKDIGAVVLHHLRSVVEVGVFAMMKHSISNGVDLALLITADPLESPLLELETDFHFDRTANLRVLIDVAFYTELMIALEQGEFGIRVILTDKGLMPIKNLVAMNVVFGHGLTFDLAKLSLVERRDAVKIHKIAEIQVFVKFVFTHVLFDCFECPLVLKRNLQIRQYDKSVWLAHNYPPYQFSKYYSHFRTAGIN